MLSKRGFTMNLPKYMEVVSDPTAPKGLKVDIHYWHPSFLKVLWLVLQDKPLCSRPFLTLVYWIKLIFRNHISS